MSRGIELPEARLWDWLDNLGLPFRQPRGALVAEYGTRAKVWTNSPQDCFLPGRRLLPGASACSFHWREGDDPTLPPDEIEAAYRGADPTRRGAAEANLATVVAALTQGLGPAYDNSVSNTRAYSWDFGMGRVKAACFPPQLNRNSGENTRYRADPGSIHECLISIRTGWIAPIAEQERDWLRGGRRAVSLDPGMYAAGGQQAPWRRLLPEFGSRMPDGCGLSADGNGFVAVMGDWFCVLPKLALLRVERHVLTPAKGRGGVWLSLTHAPPGVVLRYPHRLELGRSSYHADALSAVARSLASALGVPLYEDVSEDY